MSSTLAGLWHTLAGLAKVATYQQARAIPCDGEPHTETLAGLATLAGPLLQTRVPTRDNINKVIVLLLLLLLYP